MDVKEIIDWVALILVVVGGLNWALYAFGYNLVSIIFGAFPIVEQAVYILVGLAAIYVIYGAVTKKK